MNIKNSQTSDLSQKNDKNEFPPILQQFVQEHKVCLHVLQSFEDVISKIEQSGTNRNTEKMESLNRLFDFFNNNITLHNRKEEEILFPLLQSRLIKMNRKNKDIHQKTEVDVLEEEHIKATEIMSVLYKFFELVQDPSNDTTKTAILDACIEQVKSLIALLRKHIDNEDNIVFPLANKHITGAEFDEMKARLDKYKK